MGAEDLQLVTFTYWGFDGESRDGNIVVHSGVSRAVLAVFDSLFDNRYPIESVIPIGDLPVDAESRPDYNNTSGFHCRVVEGTNRWSDHAYGLAIDLNPLLNPFVDRDGEIWPTGAERYLDRGLGEPGMIDPAGGVVLAFESIGWEWGGNWQSIKDYHHFFAPQR
ncbi:MAG: M15 family metallopeptidase [Acidimicrobiia bacterium]